MLQILLWACGVLSVIWSLLDPRFRDVEGYLQGSSSLVITIGMALIFMGWAIVRPLKRFAFWFVLALTGQAVALQLIVAGSPLRYQHYKPFDTQPWLLTFVAIQALLVTSGFMSQRKYRKVASWLDGSFRKWQIVGMSLVIFLPSATVSASVPFYVAELCLAIAIQAVNLGNVALMVWAIPADTMASLRHCVTSWLGNADKSERRTVGRLDGFSVLLAVWVITVAAALNVLSYEQHPHVPDELAYLYHARYLAEGVVTTPAPAVPDAFELYLMQVDGEVWYPSPPPGWPAMLAIGISLGAEWLVNPVLAGVSILLSYLVLQELYSRRTARLAVFLLAVSPWYVFLGMSYMTHMFTLTCALLATLGIIWARRLNRAIWAWLGGIALGMIAIIRPLEAAAMAILLGLWAIGIGGKRLKASAIVGLVICAMLIGATTFAYNSEITGNPTNFPIMAYTDQYFGPNANAIGFGPDRGMGWALDPYPGHSPRDAIINANLNTFMLNIDLFGWSAGSLLFIGVFLFAGKFRQSDYAMLAVIVAIFGLHFFYYYSGGPDFGARYWFLMIVPLVALTARGVQVLEEKFIGKDKSARALAAVLLLIAIALVNFFPWRAIDKYHHFRGMRPDIRELAKEYEFGRSLVLIRGDGHPDYASAAAYNPIDLRDDVPVYAWDRGPEIRNEVIAAYADRPLWIVEGPALTQRGYQVIAGPLMTEELTD